MVCLCTAGAFTFVVIQSLIHLHPLVEETRSCDSWVTSALRRRSSWEYLTKMLTRLLRLLSLRALTYCWHVFVPLPACVLWRVGSALFPLCLHCCRSVTNREMIVYITLYICKEQKLVWWFYKKKRKEKKRKKKKGKTAVILRDSLDVNKEALAKVCKCHDIWSVFFFLHILYLSTLVQLKMYIFMCKTELFESYITSALQGNT